MKFKFLAPDINSNYDQVLILILVLTTPLLFLGSHLLPNTEQFKSLWNLGHIPFSMIAVLFIHNRLSLNGWVRGVWLLVFTLLASVVVEVLQTAIGREASLHDIARNFIGAGIAWFWVQKPNNLIWAGRALVLALLINECLKTINLFYGQYLFDKQIPVLSDFEHKFELQRWQGAVEITDTVSSSGEFSLKGVLTPGGITKIQFTGPPQNWSEHQNLSFDIYSEQKNNIELMLRIHDRQHAYGPYRWRYGDRYNKKLLINSGWNNFELPLNTIKNAPTRRKIDLKEITDLQVFVINPKSKLTIYIDNVRLN